MKSAIVVASIFSLSVSAFPSVWKRQFGGGGVFAGSPIDSPVKYDETAGTIRPNSRHVKATYGPYNVIPIDRHSGTKPKEALDGLGGSMGSIQNILKNAPGLSMDPAGTTILRRIKQGICQDCSVLRGRVALTDKEGSTISIGSGVYLHHIGFLPGKIGGSPQVVRSNCGGATGPKGYMGLPNMLFVQGVENFTTWYTTPTGNLNSGFYANSDTYSMIAEIINYKPEKQSVYITVDYEFVPGKPKVDAAISYISVTGCSAPRPSSPGAAPFGFTVEKGKSTRVSQKMTVVRDGTFLSMRGHMHDGGELLKLIINDKVVCASKASYGGAESTLVGADGKKWETINAMSECNDPVKVKQGDVVQLEAAFDTIAHPPRESHGHEAEEMGIYFVTFVPESV